MARHCVNKGVNSMLGCWHTIVRYHVETSNDDRRLVGFDGTQYVRDAGSGYVDHIECIMLESLSSMSAILRCVLDWELTLRSQAIAWLALGPEKAIKQTRVDSLLSNGAINYLRKSGRWGDLKKTDLNWDTAFSKYKWFPSESESLVLKVEDITQDS